MCLDNMSHYWSFRKKDVANDRLVLLNLLAAIHTFFDNRNAFVGGDIFILFLHSGTRNFRQFLDFYTIFLNRQPVTLICKQRCRSNSQIDSIETFKWTASFSSNGLGFHLLNLLTKWWYRWSMMEMKDRSMRSTSIGWQGNCNVWQKNTYEMTIYEAERLCPN